VKFTGNSAGVRKALLILLALFGAGSLGYCSSSDAAEGLSIGFGKASAGSDVCSESMLLAQEFGEQRWLALLATHGEGHCHGEVMAANVMASVARVTHIQRFSVGFGAGMLAHGDMAVGPWTLLQQPKDGPRRTDSAQFCATILMRYRVGTRFVVDWLHCSTGGATAMNRGKNWLTFGVRL